MYNIPYLIYNISYLVCDIPHPMSNVPYLVSSNPYLACNIPYILYQTFYIRCLTLPIWSANIWELLSAKCVSARNLRNSIREQVDSKSVFDADEGYTIIWFLAIICCQKGSMLGLGSLLEWTHLTPFLWDFWDFENQQYIFFCSSKTVTSMFSIS